MSKMLDPSEEVSEAVSWEDQSAINTFSKLVNRLSVREDTLKTRRQDKEYLEDLEAELELADEDESIPFKVGDAFVDLPLEEVQTRLESEKSTVSEQVDLLETEIDSIRGEMAELKVKLKSKFGDSINLES